MKDKITLANSSFEDSFNKVCLIIFWIVFILKLAETFCFINYIDPFAYHIAFARHWYETSFLEALRSNDLYLIAGLFDYFYIFPMMLFKGSRFPSLYMAQSMHFLFSIGFGSLILNRIFKGFFWGPLVGLSLLTISKSSTFFLVAKNDGAMSLAVLLCFLFVYQDNFFKSVKGLKRAMIIGLLLGLIPAIKLNGLLYVAPIGIFFVLKNIKSISSILIAFIFSLILFVPFLVKNWLFIKSPFFPALLSVFPGETTPPMLEFYSKFVGSKLELSHLLIHLKYFFMGKIIFLISIPLLILKIKKKERLTFVSSYVPFLIALAGYLIYLLINGGLPTYRFVFPGYFLMTYFLFLELENHVDFLKKYWLVPVLILLVILSDSKIDKSFKRIKTALNDRELSNEAIVDRDFTYSRFWKFVDTEEGKPVIILSDFLTNSYFAPKEVRVRASVVDRVGGEISNCASIDRLKEFEFALLKYQALNKCYNEIENSWQKLHTEGGITLYKGRN